MSGTLGPEKMLGTQFGERFFVANDTDENEYIVVLKKK